jgi:hypothetical protein
MERRVTIVGVLAVLVLVCSSVTVGQQSIPSFVNTIAVGDSLTAGFQSNSLNEKGQNNSYAAFLVRQLRTYLFLPLITEPGVPNELVLVDPGPPPVLVDTPGPSGTRGFPLLVPQNLAVPGQNTLDALTVKPDFPLDSLEDLILGVPILVIPELGIPPLSQIELAYALKPTYTLFWLGQNEVLPAVLGADPALITPFEVFQQAYQTAVGTILASGSDIIVANIPDVTLIPFLTSAEEVAELLGVPIEAIGPLLGIETGDFVTALGVPLVLEILQGNVPGPLPDNVVLTAEEAVAVETATAAMNQFIAGFGQTMGFPVVDVNTAFREIDENGLQVGDMTLTTAFLGGIFSLDGVHPTNTGYAATANIFIEKMTEYYGLPIEPVDLEAVAASDPLVPVNLMATAAPWPEVMAISAESYQVMKAVLMPRSLPVLSSPEDPEQGEDRRPVRERSPLDLSNFQDRRLQALSSFDLEPGLQRLRQGSRPVERRPAIREERPQRNQ